MPTVLLLDRLHAVAEEVFHNRGIKTETRKDLKPEELIDLIKEKEFDGMVVRSDTKVTSEVLALPSLKVVGRAGAGVDNIDVPTATENGVLVMNTPGGNSISVAEHVFALLFAMTRRIPEANTSTRSGKFEKSKFKGVEISGKTIGIIGAGNIGSLVAERAVAFGMKVLAYDPSEESKAALRAKVPSVAFVGLDGLIKQSDVLTLHTPKQKKQILDTQAFETMKKGIYIINAAREGLIDKEALKKAIEKGHVAGAAMDTFSKEKASELGLYEMEQIVVTPHIAASTKDAQIRVARMIAEQASDFLLTGNALNAVNRPPFLRREREVTKAYAL